MSIESVKKAFNSFDFTPNKGIKSSALKTNGLFHDVKKGLNQARVSFKHDQDKVSIQERIKSHLHEKDDVEIKSKNSQHNSSVSARATSSKLGTGNNYGTRSTFHANTNESLKSSASLVSQKTTNNNGVKQSVEINQQKDLKSNTQTALDRAISSKVAIESYKKAGVSVKETNTATNTQQNVSHQTNTESLTDTERTVTTQQKGKAAQESYSHQTVETSTDAASKQSLDTAATSHQVQETSTETSKRGDAQVKQTVINTNSNSQSTSNLDAAAHTDSTTTTTNLNRDGTVISQQEANHTTDVNETKNISSEEAKASQRTITQVTDGKNTLSQDVETRSDKLAQTTKDSTTTVNTTQNGDKAATTQKTLVESQSTLTKQDSLEITRQVAKGPDGVAVSGGTTGKSETNISTKVETTSAAGAVTERQIDRKITTQTDSQYEDSLQERNAKGIKSFDLAAAEASSQKTQDITKEGEKTVQANTQTQTSKELNGNISFTPQSDVAKTSNAPQATVGVSFGSYTGLAGGFKFDSGEVSFNLSFQSAQLTETDTSTTGAKGAQTATSGQTGQLSDTTLSGKLKSSVNENGDRVIEFSATYNRNGQKYVVDNNGDRKDLAVGDQNTNAEITGKFVISKNGNVKNISSEFDITKQQSGDATGTSEGAAKSALAQDDPLRNIFTYDGNGVKANLGFASMSFAVYA